MQQRNQIFIVGKWSFSKYAWVVPIKDKRGTNIVNSFQKILDRSKRKPNTICVDQGGEFYNHFFKDFWKWVTLKCIQHTMKENCCWKIYCKVEKQNL